MLFKLNVDPLLKTEIQYELKVRGFRSDGNIASFRSNLRDVLREESQDYDMVSPLLTELDSLITKLFSRPDKNLSLIIETKFSHSLGRLNNSNTIEDDEIAKEDELFVKLCSLRTRYELFAMKFDYDERLLDEIKRRTQGSDESMRIFISVMRTMFSRMTEKLSAEKQLKIILRNILSFYQTHLGLPEIYSIDELLLYGRKIEERRYAIESYVPASRKRGDLEVHLAYIRTSSAETQSTAVVMVQFRKSVLSRVPVRHLRMAVQCSRLRHKKFCYKCGKPEVTVASCPTCSRKRTKQGNGSTLIDERETKFMKSKVVLHYVLEHSTSDERPYVTVEIMGREILAY
ncbi:hypothetical protein ILUMI_14414 [Ignelater luminosus]|uniref:Uncharacterized protein n=1 Tax=Ignelater luminosus TaxID=2038154 RepID=A0A8K0CQJ6_IGNLU|nr:hypothetical protein ILUMI_14414 [Ignelater luminosus]